MRGGDEVVFLDTYYYLRVRLVLRLGLGGAEVVFIRNLQLPPIAQTFLLRGSKIIADWTKGLARRRNKGVRYSSALGSLTEEEDQTVAVYLGTKISRERLDRLAFGKTKLKITADRLMLLEDGSWSGRDEILGFIREVVRSAGGRIREITEDVRIEEVREFGRRIAMDLCVPEGCAVGGPDSEDVRLSLAVKRMDSPVRAFVAQKEGECFGCILGRFSQEGGWPPIRIEPGGRVGPRPRGGE